CGLGVTMGYDVLGVPGEPVHMKPDQPPAPFVQFPGAVATTHALIVTCWFFLGAGLRLLSLNEVAVSVAFHVCPRNVGALAGLIPNVMPVMSSPSEFGGEEPCTVNTMVTC